MRMHGKDDARRTFEINKSVADLILEDLQDRGKFYHDTCQGAFFFFEAEKTLIEIGIGNDYTLLLDNYGIRPSERSIFNYLADTFRAEAFKRGQKADIYRLSYYNPETFTIYFFNHKNRIYRISPDKIDLVDNGTDGVLFSVDSKSLPFEIEFGLKNSSWLDKIITSKINFAKDLLENEERAFVFTLWFFSLFFESIFPTKPIIAFVGEKGSGKSITMRKIGMLIFGENFNVTPMPEKSDDFDAAVTNSTFVAVDNADSKCPWLNDRLATLATGGTFKKRVLYTTNTMIEIPARCFLAITSRSPHFRRDDVADRLLIMKVERFSTFESENILLREVLNNRNKIMTEVVHHLQKIVIALKEGRNANYSNTFRMADFADFAMKVARPIGRENELKTIFTKLSREQSLFTLENDPIFELLMDWSNKNPDKAVTNIELCVELSKLADSKGIVFPYKDKGKSFAQKIGNIRENLSIFLDISCRSAKGGTKYYRYTLKEGC